MNATKIKQFAQKIKEARSRATPNFYTEHEKLRHHKDYLIGVDCCEEEPFVMADMNRSMDNWRNDLQFIALAANNIDKMADMIIEMSEALEKVQKINANSFETEEEIDNLCAKTLSKLAEGLE